MLTPGLPGFKVSCVGEYTFSLIFLTIIFFFFVRVCVCVWFHAFLWWINFKFYQTKQVKTTDAQPPITLLMVKPKTRDMTISR